MLINITYYNDGANYIKHLFSQKGESNDHYPQCCQTILKCINDKKTVNYNEFIDKMFLFIDNMITDDSFLAQTFIDCNIVEIMQKRIEESNGFNFHGMVYFLSNITIRLKDIQINEQNKSSIILCVLELFNKCNQIKTSDAILSLLAFIVRTPKDFALVKKQNVQEKLVDFMHGKSKQKTVASVFLLGNILLASNYEELVSFFKKYNPDLLKKIGLIFTPTQSKALFVHENCLNLIKMYLKVKRQNDKDNKSLRQAFRSLKKAKILTAFIEFMNCASQNPTDHSSTCLSDIYVIWLHYFDCASKRDLYDYVKKNMNFFYILFNCLGAHRNSDDMVRVLYLINYIFMLGDEFILQEQSVNKSGYTSFNYFTNIVKEDQELSDKFEAMQDHKDERISDMVDLIFEKYFPGDSTSSQFSITK